MTVLDRSSPRLTRGGAALPDPEDPSAIEPADGGSSSPRRTPAVLTLLLTVVVGAGVGWLVGGLAARGLPPLPTGVRLAQLVAVVGLVALAWWGLASWSRRRVRIVDATAVEDAAAAPLLAHLQAPDDLTLLPVLDPRSAQADTFSPLRRAVERQIGLPRPLLAVVAGSGADETPVWVGANLAIALAQAGRRVLLVDAGPPATATSDVPDVPGLAGLLGGTPTADAVTPGPVPGLDVLPPGPAQVAAPVERPVERPVGPDALDLLGSDLGVRLTAATGAYEVVVVVGPPLRRSAASQAGSTGSEADVGPSGVLVLAVAEGRARVAEVRDQVQRVRRHGGRLLGAVLVTGGR